MKCFRFPQEQAGEVTALLSANSQFEVLDKSDSNSLPASFVLLGKKFSTFGHFYCAAFCVLQSVDHATIELRISYLDVQRAWHGFNLFRSSDGKIEDQIAKYVQKHFPSANQIA
jgi:hypothetical protein